MTRAEAFELYLEARCHFDERRAEVGCALAAANVAVDRLEASRVAFNEACDLCESAFQLVSLSDGRKESTGKVAE